MSVHRYRDSDRESWDAFVRSSKNGTFLFERGYLEYHADRFPDYSFVVRNDLDQVTALLPATRAGDHVRSHAGLTYGGFVVAAETAMPPFLRCFDETLALLRDDGVTQLTYKTVPHIYHRTPAEEDRYALFLAGSTVRQCSITLACEAARSGPRQERRIRGAKKAARAGIAVRETGDIAAFWAVLEERLRERYGQSPVHTAAEISLLHERFPESIRFFGAFEREMLAAGVVIYETDRVARTQYITSTERGRETGALDLLFVELLDRVYAHKPYFDFGTSDTDYGRTLNVGLVEQKEGFGARPIAHEIHHLDLMHFVPGSISRVLD